MTTPVDVALVLWNQDVIDLISFALARRKLTCCGFELSEGPDGIEDHIVCSAPVVVVFDLHPPYEQSAQVALQLLDRFPDRAFVITCADSALALKKVPWLSAHPVFQKPYDINEIADRLLALARRAGRPAGEMAFVANCRSCM